MNMERRQFLKTAGATALGTTSLAGSASAYNRNPRNEPIGDYEYNTRHIRGLATTHVGRDHGYVPFYSVKQVYNVTLFLRNSGRYVVKYYSQSEEYLGLESTSGDGGEKVNLTIKAPKKVGKLVITRSGVGSN